MPTEPLTIVVLLGIGLAAGFLAGLLGVGGGIVLVPAMVLLLGFDQHVAQGTSLLVIVPAAVIGTWTHYRRRTVAPRDAAFVAVGGIVGAAVGSLSALALDDDLLRRLFAIVLIFVAVRMLLSSRQQPETESRLFGRATEQD